MYCMYCIYCIYVVKIKFPYFLNSIYFLLIFPSIFQYWLHIKMVSLKIIKITE